MKVYHYSGSRSVRPLWLLEELEVPYQLETIELFAGQGQRPDYLAIHPHGAVPALEDDGNVIFESGAICAYLTEKYPEGNLAPPVTIPERKVYHQWMFYVPATLEPPLWTILLHSRLLPKAKRLPQLVGRSEPQFHKVAGVLERTIADGPYLLGPHFTTADIMPGTTLRWLPKLIQDHPGLEAYSRRLLDRPAFRKALDL